MSDLAATVVAVTSARNVREFLHAVFLAAAEFFRADPRRALVVFTEPLSCGVLQRRARATFPAFIRAVCRHVRIHIDSSVAGRADLTLGAMAGSLLVTYMTRLDGRSRVTSAELADFCVDLVLSTPGVHIAARD